jgi:hypothetical protein
MLRKEIHALFQAPAAAAGEIDGEGTIRVEPKRFALVTVLLQGTQEDEALRPAGWQLTLRVHR